MVLAFVRPPSVRYNSDNPMAPVIMFMACAFMVAIFLQVGYNFFFGGIPVDVQPACYSRLEFKKSNKNGLIDLLPDLIEASRKPTKDKTIFLSEVACIESGLVEINFKQACAIESVARNHPQRDVFVLFISPVGDSSPILKNESLLQSQHPNKFYERLRLLPNVFFRNVDIWSLAKNTPLDNWINNNNGEANIFHADYFKENLDACLRLLILYKYGGMFLHTDGVVIKSLDSLASNFVPMDRYENIQTSVMNFEASGDGHEVIETMLREFESGHNRTDSPHTGHGHQTIKRVLKQRCNISNRQRNHYRSGFECNGIVLIDSWLFSPIHENNSKLLHKTSYARLVQHITHDAYIVHLWEQIENDEIEGDTMQVKTTDRFSSNAQNATEETTGYLAIVKEHCPIVYALNIEN